MEEIARVSRTDGKKRPIGLGFVAARELKSRDRRVLDKTMALGERCDL